VDEAWASLTSDQSGSVRSGELILGPRIVQKEGRKVAFWGEIRTPLDTNLVLSLVKRSKWEFEISYFGQQQNLSEEI
jgi:hypothetical protein